MASQVSPTRSWADRLTASIDGLPGPASLVYLAIGAAVYLLVAGVQWWSGDPGQAWSVQAPHLAVAITFAGWLYLIGLFDRFARAAVAGLAAAGQLREPGRQMDLAERIAAAPARLTLAVGAAVAVVAVGRILSQPEALSQISIADAPASVAMITLILGSLSFIGAAYAVKVLSIARGVSGLLATGTVVRLDDVGPMYAFSRLTAAMSVSVVGSAMLMAASAPRATADAWGTTMLLTSLALAASTFAVPLNGVHARLMEEKDRLIAVNQQQLRSAAAALHEAIGRGDLPRMDPLQKALAGLEVEMRMLTAIPTWPWRPETLRWVVGALMFPVLLFLVQELLRGTLEG